MATTRQHHASREMLYLVEEYKREHGVDEIDLAEVAQWAIRTRRWVRPPTDPEAILKRELARAMRSERVQDPQGRDVRLYYGVVHYVGERPVSTWQTTPTARPEHMRLSAAQRRHKLRWGCLQLTLDLESWNDNNPYGAAIERPSCNFEPDIEESRLPAVYHDEPVDPDDPEDEGD
jgi:hypothetical protein